MIDSYLKDSVFTAVKKGMWKGYHLLIEDVPFFEENGIYKGEGSDLGVEPQRTNICWVPPGVQTALFPKQQQQ